MKKKVDSLRRISRLQSQLHDLEAWRLADAERRQQGLMQDRVDVLAFLNADSSVGRLLTEVSMKRLQRLDQQIADATVAHKNQASATLERGAKASLASKAAKAATGRYRALQDEKSLAEAVEQWLANNRSSLRKG